MPLIHRVGRRKILLIGQGSIAVCLFLLMITSFAESPTMILLLMCMVSFIFQMTIGPLAPLYAAEVCNDVALGAVMVCEDIFTLAQVFATPDMLDGLGHGCTFGLFGLFTICGFIFIFIYVPETKGLTELEKK